MCLIQSYMEFCKLQPLPFTTRSWQELARRVENAGQTA
ncbi:hypothetical protein SXCC_00683 [Gluconacetobacter sp. SXCC-1]|nr:hypothetical protein SXCC_00683 [Gluconacetobacter sp. SXCC-1]